MKKKPNSATVGRWRRSPIKNADPVPTAPDSLDSLTRSAVRGMSRSIDGRAQRASSEQPQVRPCAFNEFSAVSPNVLTAPLVMTMDNFDLQNAIQQIALAASQMREAGYSGVVVQAIDGSLLQQFLKPTVNGRSDHWGGSLPNRARLLVMTLNAVREAVGDDCRVGLKLTLRGLKGSSTPEREDMELIRMLNYMSLDVLELIYSDIEEAGQPNPYDPLLTDELGNRGIHVDPSDRFLQDGLEVATASATMRIIVTGSACRSHV